MEENILFDRLVKYSHDELTSLSQELEITNEYLQGIDKGNNVVELLHHLIEQQHFNEAVHLLAYGLPKREAVWWAYICAISTAKQPSDKILSALQATRHWVYQQTEVARRATEKPAEALEYYAPASWAAIGAFWSGDNVAPKGKAPVKPAPYMAAQAAANAVVMAAEQSENRILSYMRFLLQGVHIANGGNGKLSSENEATILNYLES